MAETRKLAAILASDVVGYSRLAGADEDRILARLRALRSDLIDPTIAVHNGRVVKRTGDGSIVEFRSVVDAVRLAIEVQNAMVERNAGVPEDRRIVFRIGIHIGDVVEEGDGDLMGDGVNIAARLESVCEPGGLCLSEDAWRQVRDRVAVSFEDRGETALKNIARPVRAYGLSAAAIGAARSGASAPASAKKRYRALGWRFGVAAVLVASLAGAAIAWREGVAQRVLGVAVVDKLATAPKLSIVVLPFANLSDDPNQEYFADGLTDDLTTDLSHLDGSFVIARNTAFTYKGKPVDVKQIGRELGVRYALEGSVRRIGDNVTVNAQLISTETGAHVWADRFEGDRSRLGQLQVEFVSRLANSVGAELVKAEALRSLRERATNPDAADFELRGMAAYNAPPSDAAYKLAFEHFERALQLDPNLVQALAHQSLILSAKVMDFPSENLPADQARAESLSMRAINLQPHYGLGHLARAYSLFARIFVGKSEQWETAAAEAEAAIADDRNLADAYAQAGFIKLFLGRAAEGFSGLETALRLSPRDPARGNWEGSICHLHNHLAQWEQAIEWCRKSIVAQPADAIWAYLDIALAYAWAGRNAEAKQAVAEILKINPAYTVQTWEVLKFTANPTFNREYARLTEGLRKAGLPEGKERMD